MKIKKAKALGHFEREKENTIHRRAESGSFHVRPTTARPKELRLLPFFLAGSALSIRAIKGKRERAALSIRYKRFVFLKLSASCREEYFDMSTLIIRFSTRKPPRTARLLYNFMLMTNSRQTHSHGWLSRRNLCLSDSLGRSRSPRRDDAQTGRMTFHPEFN